jgi:hypothetical protein
MAINRQPQFGEDPRNARHLKRSTRSESKDISQPEPQGEMHEDPRNRRHDVRRLPGGRTAVGSQEWVDRIEKLNQSRGYNRVRIKKSETGGGS